MSALPLTLSLLFFILAVAPARSYDPYCQTMVSNASSATTWSIPASGLPTFNCTCAGSRVYQSCPTWQMLVGSDKTDVTKNYTMTSTGLSCSSIIQFNLTFRYNLSDVILRCNASKTVHDYYFKVNATSRKTRYSRALSDEMATTVGPVSTAVPLSGPATSCAAMNALRPMNPWSIRKFGSVRMTCNCFDPNHNAVCPRWIFKTGASKFIILSNTTNSINVTCSSTLSFKLRISYSLADVSLTCDGGQLKKNFNFKVTD